MPEIKRVNCVKPSIFFWQHPPTHTHILSDSVPGRADCAPRLHLNKNVIMLREKRGKEREMGSKYGRVAKLFVLIPVARQQPHPFASDPFCAI